MEWVEITAKSIAEAREAAADQLGVAEDELEFEVLEEPRSGLFGLTRGSARLRARIQPADLRPKQDRRRSRRSSGERSGKGSRGGRSGSSTSASGRGGAEREGAAVATMTDGPESDAGSADGGGSDAGGGDRGGSGRGGGRGNGRGSGGGSGRGSGGGSGRGEGRGNGRGNGRGGDEENGEEVDPAVVGAAAVTFMEGLVDSFGGQASVELLTDGVDLDVRVDGENLGLMVGSSGRTLLAIQDLVRVAAQRRLGDHTTRLKIDIAGYRERRREALAQFARQVADQVIENGVARAMEPMPSADRKVVHDVLVEIDGVESRSEGDDPNRRVIVSPA